MVKYRKFFTGRLLLYLPIHGKNLEEMLTKLNLNNSSETTTLNENLLNKSKSAFLSVLDNGGLEKL